jgi:hypothetical protein
MMVVLNGKMDLVLGLWLLQKTPKKCFNGEVYVLISPTYSGVVSSQI